MYIPTEGSVFHSAYNVEIFDILEDNFAKDISGGNVFINGDLNSGFGTAADLFNLISFIKLYRITY